ncbi:DUF1376 domain-containing protein [Hymenobacter koreensis]|uniref:DUF1376 domain-containing protein n=1 Tax=Hymenobacter koreensis TaxID=1084523 RepID=A0ABP8JD38_9BACT
MKAPAFMFYTGDFLSSPDVQIMEAHEVGAYCLLLFNAWQSDRPGYLPNDEGRLRRTARLTTAQWSDSRELLLSKFPQAPDNAALRYNPRLAAEACKQLQHREQKARAGKASAAKRATQPTPVAASATPVEHVLPKDHAASAAARPIATDVGPTSTGAQPAANTRSAKGQQKDNLSSSLSNLSTLRSEREAAGAASAPAQASTSSAKRPTKTSSPALAEVQAYAAEQHPDHAEAQTEAAAFFDHFESNGWRVGGKTPMANWRAAFRNWMRRRPQFQAAGSAKLAATPTRARTAPRPPDPNRWR